MRRPYRYDLGSSSRRRYRFHPGKQAQRRSTMTRSVTMTETTEHEGETTEATVTPPSPDRVTVDEPPLPRRTRRPIDGFRLLIVLVSITILVILAAVAERTLTSLTADLAELNAIIPGGLVGILSFASALAGQVLPPVLVVGLMIRGRVRTTVETLAAAVLAAVLAAGASAYLQGPAPDRIHDSFVPTVDGVDLSAVPAFPALLIAVVTVVARVNLPYVVQVAAFSIVGSFAVALLAGEATVGGTLISLGLGRVVGLLVRIVSGQPSVAPHGREVVEILAAHGYDVTSLVADQVDQYRRYIATTAQGTMGVLVLDRDTEGAGTLARAVDRIRTREEIRPKLTVTMRTAVDQIALQSLAAARAGARTPPLRNILRVGGNATVMVFDHIPGRALNHVSAEDISDNMLEDLWRQLARLRRNQVAHRSLSPRSILLADTGKVWLLDPSGGEVAAPDLAVRTDLAQALVASALVVGAERSVGTAVKIFGVDVVSEAIPLLQTLALAPATRRYLKGRRGLLNELRDVTVRQSGREPESPIKVQRFRPVSLLTGVAGLAAVYLVGTQLAEVSFGDLMAQTDWLWLLAALAAMTLSFVGAAFAMLGFVPERVPFWRTLGAQVSLSFLRLVAPSTVGNVAINIRLLTKAGVPGPLAAASVAANQVGNVAVTLPLIAVLGVVSGSSAAAGFDPSPSVFAVVFAVLVAAVLLSFIPPIRAWLRKMWQDFAERGLPRLLDVLSDPRKLAVAIGGILLQAGSLVMCLWFCLKAVGGAEIGRA